MTATTITKSKVGTQPQDNIFSILNNRSYIKDPRNPSSSTADRTLVYESDPFEKAVNFDGYPYIFLDFPIPEYGNVSADGKVKNVRWTHQITVRAAKRGDSNARDDIGRDDILQIADDLHETFNSETVKAILRGYNMYEVALSMTDSDSILLHDKPIYQFMFTLSYYTRMAVSA